MKWPYVGIKEEYHQDQSLWGVKIAQMRMKSLIKHWLCHSYSLEDLLIKTDKDRSKILKKKNAHISAGSLVVDYLYDMTFQEALISLSHWRSSRIFLHLKKKFSNMIKVVQETWFTKTIASSSQCLKVIKMTFFGVIISRVKTSLTHEFCLDYTLLQVTSERFRKHFQLKCKDQLCLFQMCIM